MFILRTCAASQAPLIALSQTLFPSIVSILAEYFKGVSVMAKRPMNRKEKRAEHEAFEAREREKEEAKKAKKKKKVDEDEEEDEEEAESGDEDDLDEDMDDDDAAEVSDDDLDDEAGEQEPEGEDDVDQEWLRKTKKSKAKAKAPKKPKAKKGAKTGPMRALWVVFGNSQNRVASYPYSQEKEAREHAEKLNSEKPEKKGNHFVMMVKEPME